MTHFPFLVGYDYLLNKMEATAGFPPFNIVQEGDNDYKIELALAGFSKDDIEIVQEEDRLKVYSTHNTSNNSKKYYHKGISNKKFTREFIISKDIKVQSVSYKDGLLEISLKREVPEEKQPKRFSID